MFTSKLLKESNKRYLVLISKHSDKKRKVQTNDIQSGFPVSVQLAATVVIIIATNLIKEDVSLLPIASVIGFKL